MILGFDWHLHVFEALHWSVEIKAFHTSTEIFGMWGTYNTVPKNFDIVKLGCLCFDFMRIFDAISNLFGSDFSVYNSLQYGHM